MTSRLVQEVKAQSRGHVTRSYPPFRASLHRVFPEGLNFALKKRREILKGVWQVDSSLTMNSLIFFAAVAFCLLTARQGEGKEDIKG